MTRDPRTDPRPGDVFARNYPSKRYVRHVTAVDGFHVHYFNGIGRDMIAFRASWNAWVKTATVVKRGPDE